MGVLADVQLHLVDSIDEASELKRWLSSKRIVAIDTETTGLNPLKDRVRLVQIGDQRDGWAIPWERWGGVVEEVVGRYTDTWVLHNMPYDWQMLKNTCGIELPRAKCHDTRIAAHVLNPGRSTGLKSLTATLVDPAAAYLGKQLDELLADRKTGLTWANVPIDLPAYWAYGALDPVLTMNLHDVVMPQVMADAPQAYDLECAAVWVALDMRMRGILIDHEFTQRKYDEFTEYVDRMGRWIAENYHVKPGANAEIVRLLSSYGYTFTKETQSGAISLDKEVLGEIDHPLAQAVLNRRKIQKIASTYLRNFLELSDDEWLLHPNINTLGFRQERSTQDTYGVRTSRMSMDGPNMQNLSRYQKGVQSPSNTVRNCLISRPGHTLLMVDFDQIEGRMVAHFTEDPGFIEAFTSGGDFFCNLATNIHHEPISREDPRRQSLKNGFYARSYGAGIEKFAVTAGISFEDAAFVYNTLDQQYPGFRQLTHAIERIARQRFETEGVAYVRSPLTGRRHTASEGKLYVLLNYLIQGTAAEVLKMKMVQMAAAGLDRYMVLPVHDEIISDVPDDVLPEVIESMKGIMNDATLFKVPLTASPAVGKRWGQKEDV